MNTLDRRQTPEDILNEIESRPVPPSQREFRAILGVRIIQSKDGWCIWTTSPTSCRKTGCNGSSNRCSGVYVRIVVSRWLVLPGLEPQGAQAPVSVSMIR